MTSTQSPQRRSMRPGRKIVAGGIVAGLITLGIWIAGLFDGLGFGLGRGPGSGPGNSQTTKTGDPQSRKSTPPKPSVPTDVVVVRVEPQRYLLRQTVAGKTTSHVMELSRIVELAKKASGDSTGLRVRILVGTGVPAEPVKKLKTALTNAGIDTNAIVRRNDWDRP